ncbi:hypothetical protein ACUXV3_07635 [Roseobacteraceae bacterium NS-SX3]
MPLTDPFSSRLRFYMAFLCGACIAGALVIAAFVLGYYSWQAIAVCVVIGGIAAWPAGVWATRRIKRGDPAWDHQHDESKL